MNFAKLMRKGDLVITDSELEKYFSKLRCRFTVRR